jgi:hypothetical protein
MTFQSWRNFQPWNGYPARVVLGLAHRSWLVGLVQFKPKREGVTTPTPALSDVSGEWVRRELYDLAIARLALAESALSVYRALDDGPRTSAAAERLRAFVRSARPGQCRMLSDGAACCCPLCDIDRLTSQAPK